VCVRVTVFVCMYVYVFVCVTALCVCLVSVRVHCYMHVPRPVMHSALWNNGADPQGVTLLSNRVRKPYDVMTPSCRRELGHGWHKLEILRVPGCQIYRETFL
jgi:hypothetical protein